MATLTVTVSESIILQGRNHGTTNTKSITGITGIFKRLLSVDHSAAVAVYTCGTSTKSAGSAFDSDEIEYVRMTNVGGTTIDIKIVGTGNDTIWHQLPIGASLLLFDHSASLEAHNADVAYGSRSLADISAVSAISNSSAGKLEVVIADSV
jgi:hypothetical protein